MRDPDELLRIVHAPLHGPSVTTAEMSRALALEACSIGWTEAYRHIAWLRRRPGWRTAVGHSETSLRGPGDVPVTVRRHHRPVERWAFKACDAAEPLRLAPERWLTGNAYRHPLGVVEHIAGHPHPILNPDATLAMRRGYRDFMERLEASLTLAKRRDRLVVFSGDLNVPRTSSLPFGPRQLFARLGLRSWSRGVDWIAWDPRLIAVRRSELTGGQDHPWLLIDFEGWRQT